MTASTRRADGKRTIKANDCNACHTILAQGTGAEIKQLTPERQKFNHPGGEMKAPATIAIPVDSEYPR